MSSVNKTEQQVQRDVLQFLDKKLRYTYIGNLKDRENRNIDEKRLYNWLRSMGKYPEDVAKRAIRKLVKAAGDLSKGLYTANQSVYELLKYGAVVPDEEGKNRTVYFFDFQDFSRNDFAVAEEVTVVEKENKRPDIVVYVNGIALVVLELKRSAVSVSLGIRQNLTNQKEGFIASFFSTVQYCMAANELEGLRIGTILTPEKFYTTWKDDGFTGHPEERAPQDVRITEELKNIEGPQLYRDLYAFLDKQRFMDMFHNFITFDRGIKKIARYNQYFGVKRAQMRIQHHQGGIIWHTQGSGKTLSMVFLASWILSHVEPDPRVLIITDREELDEQIEKQFKGVRRTIQRTKSCDDLITRLNSYDDSLMCSLIHKFGHHSGDVSDKDYDKYIEAIHDSLPENFKAKGHIVVFVDECHRSQSGKLHKAMKAILPDAVFIGFTGTPLLKRDKPTSMETFGSFIHTYKFDEAVADKVVLDLRYEYRSIPQAVTQPKKIDEFFERKTRGLSSRAKAKLRQKWGTMQKVYSSKDRLRKIAFDIIEDFDLNERLLNGRGNAMLVAESIYTACKFYEIFQSEGFKKCAIISSYVPQPGYLRTDTVSSDGDTDTFLKYDVYLKMLELDPKNLPPHVSIAKKVADFEEEAKRKFVEEPANMKLLIVVDKLLTGFDAPPCTYLYIDKKMRDHGLFQAVCRVNRLDDETKEYGYIVDYKQLFGKLSEAMHEYTGGAFEDYDPEDVEGLIKDREKEAIHHFGDILESLDGLCEDVPVPQGDLEYQHFFCGEAGALNEEEDEIYARLRGRLYQMVAALVRAWDEAKPYYDGKSEFTRLDNKVKFYIRIRDLIGNVSGDFLDYKAYEPDMRRLIDHYIEAGDADKDNTGVNSAPTLLQMVKKMGDILEKPDNSRKAKNGAAEAILNNIRHKIVERRFLNPVYYQDMSIILEGLVELERQGVTDYREFLKHCQDLAHKVENPEDDERYPENIRKDAALRAFYDFTKGDADLAIQLDQAVRKSRQNGFRHNQIKQRRIMNAINQVVHNEEMAEKAYKVAEAQEEYK